MNKNSNTYQILYAAVMVVLVGAVLAFVFMALKPRQDENRANDKRRQILSAVHITPPTEEQTGEYFDRYVVQQLLVDAEGNVTDSARNAAFNVDMQKNVKVPAGQRQLPVFKVRLDDQSVKYVIPAYGAGLWGPIWGYIALDSDGNTVFGTDFSHQGETPGLGARITDEDFRQQFVGKEIYKDGALLSVAVMKKGQTPSDGGDYVDAISGATITSRGVSAMLADCLRPYDAYLRRLQIGSHEQPAPTDGPAPDTNSADATADTTTTF